MAGMVKAVRENALLSRDLVVKQFHLVFFFAISIVHAKGTENRSQ
jgi:hypothetical protein